MRKIIFASALLAAFALSGAAATHDDGGCTITSSEPVADTAMGSPVSWRGAFEGEPAEGRYYVDYDAMFEIWWIYEEANGIPGLQRVDEVRMDETCGHGGDYIVF